MRGSTGLNLLDKLLLLNTYFGSFKYKAMKLLGLMLVVSILESLNIAIIYPLIEIISGEKSEGMMSNITSFFLRDVEQANKVLYVMLSLSGLLIAKFILKIALFYLDIQFQTTLLSDWQNRLIKVYLNLSPKNFSTTRHGEKVNTIFNETNKAIQGISDILQFFLKVFNATAYSVLLLLTSWKLTILCLLIIITFGTLLTAFTKKPMKSIASRRLMNDENLNSFVNESLLGISVVRLFNLYRFINQKISLFLTKYKTLTIKQVMLERLPVPFGELIVFSCVVMTVLYVEYVDEELTLKEFIPTMSIFALTLKPLMASISELIALRIGIFARMPSIGIVQSNLAQSTSSIYDIDKNIAPLKLKNDIRLEDISFSYDGSTTVISNANLIIKKNRITAIIGPSGIGKSTIIDLLLGFYEPTAGSIFHDGKPVDRNNIRSWRNLFGVVSQQVILFNMSVKDNITVGLDSYDEQLFLSVCNKAQCHDFVSKLPDGYNTIIGDRGNSLSGGQMQRIVIARALMRNPEVLILDEATSALDNESESLLMNVIKALSKEKTILIITHKISSIKEADKIYQFNSDGRLNETDYKTIG